MSPPPPTGRRTAAEVRAARTPSPAQVQANWSRTDCPDLERRCVRRGRLSASTDRRSSPAADIKRHPGTGGADRRAHVLTRRGGIEGAASVAARDPGWTYPDGLGIVPGREERHMEDALGGRSPRVRGRASSAAVAQSGPRAPIGCLGCQTSALSRTRIFGDS
jgi:hypothetical protein